MIPQELRGLFWNFAAIAVAVVIALFSIYILKMGNDNAVEEAAEDFIEHSIGIKIDLSEGEE